MIADQRLMPIFSFRKIIEKIVIKNGEVKNKVFATAKLKLERET